MSERVTIGNTTYEAVGSSTANLLLKCNGTARIQWGSRLIDLIKNGRIASSESKETLFVVYDEAEMKDDGIYVIINDDGSYSIYFYKDGQKYVLAESDLYVSATKQQELTVEQKSQVQQNIGVCYKTLDEFKASNIKDGFAYITSEKRFYIAQNGIIEKFNTDSQNSVTVENINT